MTARELFSLALWLAAIGHLVVLAAGLQAPYRLRWREDFAKLVPFNRKIFWVYSAYIVMFIAAFSAFTFYFHDELLRGDRTALAVALFIGVFWLGRIAVDFFYYRHSDWPRGRGFAIGHVMLTSLFICLSGTYLGLVAWHANWL